MVFLAICMAEFKQSMVKVVLLLIGPKVLEPDKGCEPPQKPLLLVVQKLALLLDQTTLTLDP